MQVGGDWLGFQKKKHENEAVTVLLRHLYKGLLWLGFWMDVGWLGGGKTTPPTGKLEKTQNWSGPKARDDFFVSKI